MKPPSFDYAVPASLTEAVSLLDDYQGEAKVLAGGQSLMPLLNMRLARPGLLVDLARLPGLDNIREVDGGVAIGAMTRQRAVERSELVSGRHPLLHAATLCIAHPQNRNQGTLGGSLAHADPAADYPAVALTLGAKFRVAGPGGERELAAADFFVSYMTTALEPAEILTEVWFPQLGERSGWAFKEITRRHGDFAMAGCATVVTLDDGGRCSRARVVAFGVAPTPLRVEAAEQAIVGQAPSDRVFEEAAAKTREAVDQALGDVHASAEYRRHLAGVLTERALAEAARRAADAGG
ncbi:MAG: FAD binding domain-containing protein [Candidatus Binatia bacterium]